MSKSLASQKVVTKLQGPTQVFPRKNVLCKLLCKHKFNAPFNPGYSLQQKIFLIDIKIIQLDKNLLEMLNKFTRLLLSSFSANEIRLDVWHLLNFS
jgi:hypothetical protein